MELGNLGALFGLAIGFTAILLLLSMVVTALSQGIQSALRLRGRATYTVLERFLCREKKMLPGAARVVADEMLHRTGASTARPGMSAMTRRLQWWVLGPEERVVFPETLHDMGLSSTQRERFNALVSDCFTRWMRWVSLACALAVAFTFQVSATTLLNDLSADPSLRLRALEVAERLEREEARVGVASVTFGELQHQAAAKLAGEFPSLKDELEKVSGKAPDLAGAQAELALILEAQPNAPLVLSRHRAVLTELVRQQAAESRELAELAQKQLALVRIEFWREGWGFYRKDGGLHWGNLVGVLLTTLLISLGAPFWYDRLRNLNVLRDTLYRGSTVTSGVTTVTTKPATVTVVQDPAGGVAAHGSAEIESTASATVTIPSDAPRTAPSESGRHERDVPGAQPTGKPSATGGTRT